MSAQVNQCPSASPPPSPPTHSSPASDTGRRTTRPVPAPSARRTEISPAPRGGAREQQIGDIDAADEQHAGNGGHEDDEREPRRAGVGAGKGLDPRRPPGVARALLRRELRTNPRELAAHVVNGRGTRQSRNHLERPDPALGRHEPVHRHAAPRLALVREREPARHDTDDLARQMPGATEVSTSAFADAIIEHLS